MAKRTNLSRGLRVNSTEQIDAILQVFEEREGIPLEADQKKITLAIFTQDELFQTMVYEVHKVYHTKRGLVADLIPQAEVKTRSFKVHAKKGDGGD